MNSSREAKAACASGSVGGLNCAALVIFRTESGRADCGYDGEELLERHLEVEKATLTEDPTVVVEDFIWNHQRKTRQARNNRNSARSVQRRQKSIRRSTSPSYHNARLS